jgi:uncharacterized membrane protein
MTIINSNDIEIINGMIIIFFVLLYMFYIIYKQFYPNKKSHIKDNFEKFMLMVVMTIGCPVVCCMVCFILNILY